MRILFARAALFGFAICCFLPSRFLPPTARATVEKTPTPTENQPQNLRLLRRLPRPVLPSASNGWWTASNNSKNASPN